MILNKLNFKQQHFLLSLSNYEKNRVTHRCVSTSKIGLLSPVISPMILTGLQVIEVKRITSFIFSHIKKKPLSNKELSYVLYRASIINLKFTQAIAHTLFPNLEVPNYEITSDMTVMPPVLRLFDLLSLHYGENVFLKSPFFKGTKFTLLEAPVVCNPKTINTLALAQTGQKYPDYHVYFIKDNKIHYFDLKSGEYGPFTGHLILAQTPEAYQRMSKTLIYQHLEFWKNQPKEYTDIFYKRLLQIASDSSKSWEQKNILMQEFYSKSIQLLPKDKSPTLLFQVVTDYEVEKTSPGTLPITKDIFNSPKNTEQALINCVLGSSSTTKNNFVAMKAVSPVIKDFALQSLKELFQHTTSVIS